MVERETESGEGLMYLTGATNREIEQRLIANGIGLMLNPASGYRPEQIQRYPAYAIDNGCFAAGDSFDVKAWLSFVEQFKPVANRCLFVVAPDVVGDAAATRERCRDILPIIRDMGFPAAFVAQDGQESLPVPWSAFDCLFIGGSTDWKLSEPAYGLVTEAKRRGRWAHMGRVNGWRRFRACLVSGFDSCDGTYIAFNPTEFAERSERWMQRARLQRRLWEVL